ncbi:hypothetical protein CBR_g6655 [Chara braunii]|uniref:AP complex subunit sigma n=1 Tax=Chara braunii TaxID=69332 RepID=A0A388KKH0_CHABU|nr:hypothetical protein CBR_g6655 [Chara braunii]|eukprot:GBG70527.1 hypothetical protein CBR_g6655 [Chara braunii]
MIKAVLIVNNHGKPRLTKFYERISPEKQQEVIRASFLVLSQRPPNVCGFVEDDAVFGKNIKIVYRHFATLYFIFLVDKSESELGILDLIQVFVGTLDKCFENVCELDLTFNLNKVHTILNEIVMGGQVLETNSVEISKALEDINRLERMPEPLPTQLKGPIRR